MNFQTKPKNVVILSLIMLSAVPVFSQSQTVKNKLNAAKPSAARPVVILTQPKAAVWIDDLRRGTTDDKGQLKIEKVGSARKKLRVRAFGFAEKTLILPRLSNREIKVELAKTTDAAELAFQQAEELRESESEANRSKAVEFYRQALKAKSDYPAAAIGLARVLGDLHEVEEALTAVAIARKLRPVFAEASTVEGRIYRTDNDSDNAVKSFQRALREARNIAPEAHTGLALAFEDRGEIEKAAAEFRIAIAQFDETEPVIYKLAGDNYVQMQRPKEAIANYEKFLQLAPNDREAAAYRSIIEQLKKQNSAETLELMPQ